MDDRFLLLVEDNPSDEELMLRTLDKHHLANRVAITRDGQEALDFVFAKGKYCDRNPADLPLVVLLDIKLPKLDGMEVLQAIRANPRTHLLPVVMLTSSDEESDMVRCYELGVNSFVKKPVDFGEFSTAIAQVGMYWLAINRQPPRVG